jgi:hypothetical protein
MGRLSQIQRQLEARRAANSAKALAQASERASQEFDLEFIARVREAALSGIKETDLSHVLKAIVDNKVVVPQVNMEPIVAAVRSAVLSMREVVKAESNALRNSIPKPQKLPVMDVDLSPVLDDLQWLKSVIALQKKEWIFTVERDRQGFIETVKAE